MSQNLLVPGTGGVTLQDDAGVDLGYPVRLRLGTATGGLVGRSAAELIDLLSMEHAAGQWAPRKTTLVPGKHLRPGKPVAVAYNQFLGSYNSFNYDWRADLRWNASLLLDFLLDRRPSQGRWNLVGHSQGALLIVLASKQLADVDAWSELVGSVLLVGAPLAGSINSAVALGAGDPLGAANRAEFVQIARTWPALYQMLPSWAEAIVHDDGSPTGLAATDPAAWAGHAGIDRDFLARADDVMAQLRDPAQFMNLRSTRFRIVLAFNRWTASDLIRDGVLTIQPDSEEIGDTLVPYETTLDWLGPRLRRAVRPFGDGSSPHSFLCTDEGVRTLARQLAR